MICIGGALNPAAIVANRGVMPASAAAMRAACLTAESGFTNTGQIDHAKLAWLGDVFAIPSGWPLANVFSIGDIAAVIGVGYLAHRWYRSSDLGSARQRTDSAAIV